MLSQFNNAHTVIEFPALPWEKVLAVIKFCMQLDYRYIQFPSGAFTGLLPSLIPAPASF